MLSRLYAPALAALFCSLLLLASTVFAAEEAQSAPKAIPEPTRSVTHHKGKFGERTIAFQVTAGDTHLYNDQGDATASIFSIAYTKEGVKDPSKRPVTFVFNGGPGSSSVWLHMGLFGPKRIDVPSDALNGGAPPYTLQDNPLSLLEVSDLVFIDPVGTGFSKPLGASTGEDFWGVKKDAESLAEFIRLYIAENNRWNSPKYLSGESYGTTRAGALVKELQEGWGSIYLNGVILISAILDFQTGDFTPGNDLPHVTFLPTFAATAWYHNALPQRPDDLDTFLADVREFAMTDYTVALMKGSLLSEQDEQRIIDRLHAYTGLSKTYLKQTRLRINEFRFMKELLRERGQVVGRLDSRYLGTDADDAGEAFEADPSGYAIDAPYTAAVNHYFHDQLDVVRSEKYHILNPEVYRNWEWSLGGGARSEGFINVTPFIAKAMRQNKDFRVFVANGYYDVATPFFATELSLNHYGIDRDRVDMHYYEAGHMMYVHQESLQALAKDVRAFIQAGH